MLVFYICNSVPLCLRVKIFESDFDSFNPIHLYYLFSNQLQPRDNHFKMHEIFMRVYVKVVVVWLLVVGVINLTWQFKHRGTEVQSFNLMWCLMRNWYWSKGAEASCDAGGGTELDSIFIWHLYHSVHISPRSFNIAHCPNSPNSPQALYLRKVAYDPQCL